jgi:phosphohistidine swiveling domain-containing protein
VVNAAVPLPDRWFTDTPTSSRFPIYTRGNADEVGPEPYSPLGWSLTWEQGIAPGTADGWVSLGGFTPEEFTWPVPETFGNWGGYFFNQVSMGRVFGVRAPGGSPDLVDAQFFGKNRSVPPYVPDPRDESPERSEAIGARFAEILGATQQPGYLTDFIAQVHAWSQERPDLAALTDAELIAHGRTANYRQRPTWDIYCLITIAATVGPSVVGPIAASLGFPNAATEVFSAIGGVASAATAERVWGLSRLARGSERVSAELDAGIDGAIGRLRASQDKEAGAFVEEFEHLIAVDGHRGPNEWDISSDSWVLRPELPLSMIDQLRRQDDDHAPAARAVALTARREQLVSQLLAAAAGDAATQGVLASALRSGTVFYQAREQGKDAAVRAMLEAKLPFVELGRRWAERGVIEHPKHVFMLLDRELDEIATAPEGWRERLAQRAAEFAELGARVPPYVVVHGEPLPPLSRWPLRVGGAGVTRAVAGNELTGLGVSPGVARGRARVVAGLADITDLDPGDIIVCSTTDPSWVPLFLIAGGVVCDIGAPSSHAAIVSRELGVPCVVSVARARDRIADGAHVEIDGLAGTVRILEGAPG